MPSPAVHPANDKAHLEKRGQTYLCVMAVPRPLRPIMGKAKLLRSLQTGDLKLAQRRRRAVLAEFEAAFEAARNAAAGGPETLTGEALRYRAMVAAFPVEDPVEDLDTGELHTPYGASDWIDDTVDALVRNHGREAAERFGAIASGHATPITLHTEGWLKEGHYPPRSCLQHRSTVAELVAWCGGEGVAADIEAITKQVAGRFASAAGSARGVARTTVNRKLSSLRSYWRWLERKGHVGANPWLGQTLPAPRLPDEADGSRRFTEAEAVALLTGDAHLVLHDMMRLAALTGGRLGGLARLTVADCRDGWFLIRRDKTKAGRRRVPQHPDLATIIERRTAGKPATAWLFDELTTDKQGERTAHVSKLFTAYRQRLGIEDKPAGQRRSNVTFHSWRHWFISQARHAGQDEAIVQQVVGQKPQSVMARVYYAGGEDAALRACVEAVKLPV